MNGWIKLHRKFTEWGYYGNSQAVHLFVHFLINANYEDKDWNGITIKRGQLVTGLKSIQEATGISMQSTRTLLKKLELTKEIVVKSTNKYSIVTICKYDDYQFENDTTNKQLTNNQQTTNKQLTTTKEYKEEKNIIKGKNWRDDFEVYLKECREAFDKAWQDETFLAEQQRFNPNVNIKLTLEKAFKNYWGTVAGWEHKRKKKSATINWQSTIKNAITLNKVYYTKAEQAELFK